jgi:hypothetical protein
MGKYWPKKGQLKILSMALDLLVNFWLNFGDEFQAGRAVNFALFFKV